MSEQTGGRQYTMRDHLITSFWVGFLLGATLMAIVAALLR
jgi:hypothetical protein